jgi:hypothetical protein
MSKLPTNYQRFGGVVLVYHFKYHPRGTHTLTIVFADFQFPPHGGITFAQQAADSPLPRPSLRCLLMLGAED